MKKLIVLVIALIAFIFSGCGGGDTASSTPLETVQKYEIKNDTNHALMGPLEGATVQVYRLSDLNNSITTVTTGSFGSFNLSLDNIADEEVLLVSVSGGKDIDVNDDGIIDDVPTVNKGTIHLLATAQELRDEKINVTLLSEITYQYVKQYIGKVDSQDLLYFTQIIDSKLTKESINRSFFIFNPVSQEDRQKLAFDYTKLIDGDNSLSTLYHEGRSQEEIEKKLNDLFSEVLSINDSSLLDAKEHYKVSLMPPIGANITSDNSSIFFDFDHNTSNLEEYVTKDANLTFVANVQSGYKIVRWVGCDSVSDDNTTCYIRSLNEDRSISPVVLSDEIIFNHNIVIRDVSNAHIVIDTNETYILTSDLNDSNTTEVLNEINVGDVIVSKIEPVFFKKVTSIDKIDDNNFKVGVEFIPLEEVVTQGHLSTSMKADGIEVASQSTRFVTRNGKSITLKPTVTGEYNLVFNKKINKRGFEATVTPISHDFGDGVKIVGSVKIEPRFIVDMDWKVFGGLRYLRIEPGFKITPNIELKVEKEKSFGGTQNDYYIGAISSTQVYMVGLIPVSITEDIKLYIGAEGSVKSSVSFGGEITLDQSYPLTWNESEGLHFHPILNKTIGSVKLPEGKIEAEAGAYLKVEPGVRVYIVGVGISNKIGLYGQTGAAAGLTLTYTGNRVTEEVAKAYFELYVKYQRQFTLSVPSSFANNDFVKALKADFEKQFPPMGEIKYSIGKIEVGLLESTVLPKKPGKLSVTGNDFSAELMSSDFIHKTLVYQLENTGEEDVYWKASFYENRGLLNDNIIYPSFGKLAPNEKIDVLVELSSDDLSAYKGVNKGIINFYSSKEEISPWHPPMAMPSNYIDSIIPKFSYNIDLKVHRKLEPVKNASLEVTGDSFKNIKVHFDRSVEYVDGYRIDIADYNTTTQECYNNYQELYYLSGHNSTTYQVMMDSLIDNNTVKVGNSYCLNIVSILHNDNSLYTTSLYMENPLILEIPAYGALESNIADIDGHAIENARVYLTSIASNTQTDGSGNYVFENLLPGRYKIVVTADGYIPVEAEVTIEAGVTKIFERQLVAEDSLEGLEGIIAGKVQNALNGSGVSNATLEVRKGINILSGEVLKTITSDDNGNYSLELPTGSYTLVVHAEGYTDTSVTINVVGNQTKQKDLSISPLLEEGNLRIVLSWGASPQDLDSHLVKSVNNEQEYHIFYGHSQGTNGDNLDYDDVNGYGPETITVTNVNRSAVYKYYVHDYSNYSNHSDPYLKASSAKVDVYYGNESKTFYVPNQNGNAWKVFEIVNGEIIPCTNECVFGVDGESDSQIGSRSVDILQDSRLFQELPEK